MIVNRKAGQTAYLNLSNEVLATPLVYRSPVFFFFNTLQVETIAIEISLDLGSMWQV